jgi:hypothetical protein
MTADEPRHIAPSHFGDDDVFHKPVVTRGPNVPELIEQYRATGKVKQADLADLLAAIGLLYEAFGEDMPSAFRSGNNIPIPVEVLATVIAALTGQWTLRKHNAERREKAKSLQVRRDSLLRQEGLSKREAARRVVEQECPGLAETAEEFRKHWETLRKK